METKSAPSVLRSILPLWQQRYKAALSRRTLIRRPSSRTMSNESGLLYSRTAQLVKSSTSNLASVSVLTEWWRTYHTYITMHSKYHGQRQGITRSWSTIRLDLLWTHILSLFFLSFSGFFSASPSRWPYNRSFRRMDIPRWQVARLLSTPASPSMPTSSLISDRRAVHPRRRTSYLAPATVPRPGSGSGAQ